MMVCSLYENIALQSEGSYSEQTTNGSRTFVVFFELRCPLLSHGIVHIGIFGLSCELAQIGILSVSRWVDNHSDLLDLASSISENISIIHTYSHCKLPTVKSKENTACLNLFE